jgi:hypothetical protein
MWSKNQQVVQEIDRMVGFGEVRCDVHRLMHRDWGLRMSWGIGRIRKETGLLEQFV